MEQTKKEEKLLIIDGSSLLVTAYHGTMPFSYRMAKTDEQKALALKDFMQTKSGVYTNAVFTMVKTILKLIEEMKPTHLAVAWDISRDTFRKKIYSGYKANRPESDAALIEQFITAQSLLRDMGIHQFMDTEYEADDFAGSCAKKFENEIPTYLLSKDKDYLQLVNEKTSLLLGTKDAKELHKKYYGDEPHIPDSAVKLTPKLVKEIFGIWPNQVADWKALSGDSADNIPGVKGVGDKSTIPMLQEYGTIEKLYDVLNAADEKGKKELKAFWKAEKGVTLPLANLMKESEKDELGNIVTPLGHDAAVLYKEIATIKCDIELPITLKDLVLEINKDKMLKKFKELEFDSLASSLEPN